MAESLFDIFGDRTQVIKNVSRQPLPNIENMGKSVTAGPYKPNEPIKKTGEPKKSFLSNTGKALQMTPARQVFTPRGMNVGSVIYTDDNSTNKPILNKDFNNEEIEFTKPSLKQNTYNSEMFDFLLPEFKMAEHVKPPSTPPPKDKRHSMELDCSYDDEFFTDYFANYSTLDNSLQDDIPALY